jgi:large subunit ribosomal protein L6
MSRVGKQPVVIPSNVKVSINKRLVQIEGPRGKLEYEYSPEVAVKQEDGRLIVEPLRNDKPTRASWGSTRAHLHNMVIGVSQGWRRELELQGVGYGAKLQGQEIVLTVGLSHEPRIPLPQGIECKIDKSVIQLQSADRQAVGDFAARIRRVRKPEPYLGKGIRYVGERVRRKAGKAGKAA